MYYGGVYYNQKKPLIPGHFDRSNLSQNMNWSKLNGPLSSVLKIGFHRLVLGFEILLQIVNHGVQKEVMQRMREVADEFFKLPVEEKEKYAMPSNDIQGYGHAYVVSEEQTLDWSDALILVIYPNRYRKLQLWPKSPQGFKYAFLKF
jgi:hypothetical protein